MYIPEVPTRPPAAAERCVCSRCGAHLTCTTGLATVAGRCGVCGCTDTQPLVRRNASRSGRNFAVASIAEVDMMSDSGYGAIVLDRLTTHTAQILAVDQSCIFARDQSDPGMRIVAAAHGAAEESVGKRVRVTAGAARGLPVAGTAVEVQWEGEVQGALSIWCGSSARDFSEAEFRVLRALGHGAAAALAHAYTRPPSAGDIRAPIRSMANSLAALDPGTAEHSRDVVELACELGKTAGFSRAGLAELGVAALLHDIGKMRVPGSILDKPSGLSPDEREVIARHPILGAETLMRIPGLEVVATLVRYHHERWDGGGYPDGLSGHRIPRQSRIIAVCDAYSAMTSDRPYRDAMSQERAFSELRAGAGWQFDAEVVAQLEDLVSRRAAA